MDGFEFVARTRADPVLRDDPGDPGDLARSAGGPARAGDEAGARGTSSRASSIRPCCSRPSASWWGETMAKIRVLVVEDSLDGAQAPRRGARGAIPSSRSSARPTTASEAIELCQTLRPDVMTLDMMLPVMSGLAATEYIMAYCPTPILIVSASTNRGELFKTYDALAAGAVDVLEKPRGDEPRRRLGARLVVDGQARRAHQGHHAPARAAERERASRTHARPPCAASASPIAPRGSSRSARRRAARARIVDDPARAAAELPAAHPARHPHRRAVRRRVRRLARRSVGRSGRLRAGRRAARRRVAGRVVMAPPDRHLVVRGGRLRLTSRSRAPLLPPVGRRALRVARARAGERAASRACSPGWAATARRAARDPPRRRASRIAQDEATSVVFGMPREAVAARTRPSACCRSSEIGPALAALAAPAASGVAHERRRPHRRRQPDGPHGPRRRRSRPPASRATSCATLAEAREALARERVRARSSSTCSCPTATASSSRGAPTRRRRRSDCR